MLPATQDQKNCEILLGKYACDGKKSVTNSERVVYVKYYYLACGGSHLSRAEEIWN